jgi:hypothetical protein
VVISRNGVLEAAHALVVQPGISRQRFDAPAHPLCAENAPDANAGWPPVERSLVSVEDRESPLLSVIDRQFRRQCDLNHTVLALAILSPSPG